MNQFKYTIKKWVKSPVAGAPHAGSWQPVSGFPVYPLGKANLLDERLDEAHLTLYNSEEKIIKPGTLVMISFSQSGDRIDTRDWQYIVANDDATEKVPGSGKWSHDLYLLEPIKYFEGILCQTKTDTNPLGEMYSSVYAGYYVERDDERSLYDATEGDRIRDFDLRATYTSSFSRSFPTPRQIAQCFQIEWGQDTPVPITYNGECIITDEDGGTSHFNDDMIPTVPAHSANYVSLYYTVSLSNSSAQILYFSHITFNISFTDDNYPLAKWNFASAVTRTLELAEPVYSGELPHYRLNGVSYDEDGNAQYEEGSQAEKFAKIETPPFTLTQANLREQLRAYGKFIEAEPRAFYNTDSAANPFWEIFFDDLSSQSEASLPAYIDRAANISINEYSTEIRGNAQNLVNSLGYAKGAMIDPGKNIVRSIRTEQSNVRIETENAIVETAQKIYTKIEVECGILNEDGTYFVPMTKITACVVESTAYQSMSAYGETFPVSRACALYYTRGEKNIKGLFYQAPKAYQGAVFSHYAISNVLANSGAPKTAAEIDNYLSHGTVTYVSPFVPADATAFGRLVFRVTYQPLYDTMFAHGKQEYDPTVDKFEQIYNQSENLIETRFFGENVKGVSARLGNVTESRTYIFHDIDEIPQAGQTVDGMVIDAVSCEINPYFIKCTIGLSAFNRISQYVGINSNKRVYQVSEREAYERTAILRDYLLIYDAAHTPGYRPTARLFHNIVPITDAFKQITNNVSSVSSALLITKRKNGDEIARVRLPVTTSTFGNAMTFSFSAKDNYSAGSRAQKVVGDNGTSKITGYWQTDVPYSDYYGRAWFAEFRLDKGSGSAYDLPYVTSAAVASDATIYNTDADYLLRKDSREKIGFAVTLEAKTTVPGLYIGSGLMMNSTYLNGTTHDKPKLYGIKAGSSVNRFTSNIADARNIAENIGSFVLSADGKTLTVTILPPQAGGYIGYVIANAPKSETRTVFDEATGENITVSETTGGEVLLTRFVDITASTEETFTFELIADK